MSDAEAAVIQAARDLFRVNAPMVEKLGPLAEAIDRLDQEAADRSDRGIDPAGV